MCKIAQAAEIDDMNHWDEVRTAYFVACEGTVSGAAEALGVHHATVIRHIDALEERLGVKLFQRHARGYTPTEAGEDLARVARATDDQMAQLQGRLKGGSNTVSGELVITALPGMSAALVPIMASFQRLYPDIRLRFMAATRLFKLEYGEAHVAIRGGQMPSDQLDNVVQSFASTDLGLFAAQSYVDRQGPIETFKGHNFIGPVGDAKRAPFNRWLSEQIDENQYVLRTDDMYASRAAVYAGMGIGFLSRDSALADGMVEIRQPLEEWRVPVWLVTHVDLHRTAKVQAFLSHLKEQAKFIALLP